MQHDYVDTKRILDPLGPPTSPPPHPGPAPRGHMKIPNVPPVLIHTAIACESFENLVKWSRSNGVTLQMDRRPDGR